MELTIDRIIADLEREINEGNQTKAAWTLNVGGVKYSVTAYRIRTQGLIRVDIKKEALSDGL